MTEMEFLQKEEERFRNCMEMHENCVKNLREEINVIQKIRKSLQGQPDCVLELSNSEALSEIPERVKSLAEKVVSVM